MKYGFKQGNGSEVEYMGKNKGNNEWEGVIIACIFNNYPYGVSMILIRKFWNGRPWYLQNIDDLLIFCKIYAQGLDKEIRHFF